MSDTKREEGRRILRRAMEQGGADLHLHTSASDGTATPEQLVQEVLRLGLRVFSVTDHDTIAAVPTVASLLARQPVPPPRFIPGVELSTDREMPDGVTRELHLLGYFPLGGIERLEPELDRQRQRRAERNVRMCRLLTGLGMPVSVSELEEESRRHGGPSAGHGAVVGRVQAAKVLVRKGFAANRRDAFSRFLNPGRPGYADRERLTTEAAIAMVHRADGVSVLAHPHIYGWTGSGHGLGGSTLAEVLAELAEAGLDGVEAFHGEAPEQAVGEIVRAGAAAGLILTGGSDWHGDNRHASMYSGQTDWSSWLRKPDTAD